MSDTTVRRPTLPHWAQTETCDDCGQPLWPWQACSSNGRKWHSGGCERANTDGPRNIVEQVCILLQANVRACDILGRAVSETPDEMWNDEIGQPLFAAQHALDHARSLWAALRTGEFDVEEPVS